MSGGDPATTPGAVRTAVGLMYLGAGLEVLDTLGALVLAAADDRSYAAGTLVGTAIVVVLWLWMAGAIGRGKPWARVVGTVFGIVNVLGGFASLAFLPGEDSLGGWDTLMSTASAALAAVILVLLYRDESNRWFAGRGPDTA